MIDQPHVHEIIYTIDTIDSVAYEICNLMAHARVLTFTGDLGAGKTTLIQAILEQSGIHGAKPSPTYAYMNQYTNAQGQTFYHFDLYRMSSEQSFIDAGFYEYLYVPNTYALIEWPEIITGLLTRDVCHIYISHYGHKKRRVRYVCT